jgi:hypothetical protein
MPLNPAHWRPTAIVRYVEGLGTSTNVMRVETDAGEGFIKTLGNPEGPHALVSEWVGTPTHCFGDTLQFTSALANISAVQDERIFGLFQEFEPYLKNADLQSACVMLSTVTVEQVRPR